MPRAPLSLRARALGYLARREHARAELLAKLRRHAAPEDDVDALLDDFERRGWLSEERMVEQFVSGKHRFGAARLLNDLRRKGVDAKLIEAAAGPLRATEFATALAVWQRKFGALPEDPASRLKQMRFLHNRGFSHDTIGRLLRGRWRADSDER